MRKYENVIIIKPNLSKNELNQIISKIDNKISEFAKITNKKDKGIRKLAYTVRKNEEGHYFVYQFQIEENMKNCAIEEIERFYRITDEIIKFLIIKL